MHIDGRKWSTVTNYVLANLLVTPIYKTSLQLSPTYGDTRDMPESSINNRITQLIANTELRQNRVLNKQEKELIKQRVLSEMSFNRLDIFQKYAYYLNLERQEATRKAVEEAYMAKITESPELANSLLLTENSPIEYVSDNAFLGVGKDGSGMNVIGKVLMQIRHNLYTQKRIEENMEKDEEKNKLVFETYKAYIMLLQEIGRLNNLKDYMNLTPKDIISLYKSKHPDDVNISKASKKIIQDMVSKGQLPIIKEIIEKPELAKSLASLVYNANRKHIRLGMLNKHNEIIAKIYTQYILKEKFPEMPKGKVKEASLQLELVTSTPSEYKELVDKIVNKYYSGDLPGKVVQKINSALEEYPLDMEEKKEKDEEDKESEEKDEKEEKKEEESRSSSGDVEREILLVKLSDYTGKAPRTYREWSTDKIQRHVQRYEGEKEPKTKGAWKVIIKHRRNNKKEIIMVSGVKPDKEKLVKKYNKEHPDTQINRRQVLVLWVPERNQPNGDEDDKELESEVKQPLFEKVEGKPIQIYADISKNPDKLKELSPLYEKEFIIANSAYPSVSIYITVKLMTLTGMSSNVKQKGMFSKGMSVLEARNAVLDKGLPFVSSGKKFVSPDKANQIYADEDRRAMHELFKNFLRVALNKKFEDSNLQNILLLTKTKKLVWDDPTDPANVVGEELMSVRKNILVKREGKKYPLVNVTDTKTFMHKDPFMESWLEMRLKEMCSVVYKVKQYVAPDEKLTPVFIENVLDNILHPCEGINSLAKNVVIPVSNEFITMVKDCYGIDMRLSTDYDGQKANILRQIQALEDEFTGVKKDSDLPEQDSDQQYRQEWVTLLNELDKPALSMEVIEEKLAKFDKKHGKDHKDRKAYLQKLYKPGISTEQRNARIEELTKKYRKARGVAIGQIKKEEYAEKLKTYKQQLVDVSANKKEETRKIQEEVKSIAEVYWNRIITMIVYIIEHMKDTSQQDIRQVIVDSELVTSQEASCVNIPGFTNQADNCVASALINVLTAIQNIKRAYNIKSLSTGDIDLAGSIIINRVVSEKQMTEGILEVEAPELAGEEEIEDANVDQESDVEDGDYGDVDESGDFGMGKKVKLTPKEHMKIVLKELASGEAVSIEELSEYFLGMVNVIKSSQLSQYVKQNRINFFATLA
jgi:predicted NAD-dependent protein-ADP-ribosyltransferase YbiA (DUF1768 family)